MTSRLTGLVQEADRLKPGGLTPDQIAERQIRHARWLLEQAAPQVASMPSTAEALEAARQLLGQIAGDYRVDEEAAFANEHP
jgi:hypothetical protein